MTFTYEFQHSGSNRRVRAQLHRLINTIDEESFHDLETAQASAVDALAAQQKRSEQRKSARAALREAAKGGRPA